MPKLSQIDCVTWKEGRERAVALALSCTNSAFMHQILIRISKVCKQKYLKMFNAKLIDLFVTFLCRNGYTVLLSACIERLIIVMCRHCNVEQKRSTFYDCGIS